MPVMVRKAQGRFRIVESGSGKLVKRGGSAVDGGGHASKENAESQARAINASLSKAGKI